MYNKSDKSKYHEEIKNVNDNDVNTLLMVVSVSRGSTFVESS